MAAAQQGALFPLPDFPIPDPDNDDPENLRAVIDRFDELALDERKDVFSYYKLKAKERELAEEGVLWEILYTDLMVVDTARMEKDSLIDLRKCLRMLEQNKRKLFKYIYRKKLEDIKGHDTENTEKKIALFQMLVTSCKTKVRAMLEATQLESNYVYLQAKEEYVNDLMEKELNGLFKEEAAEKLRAVYTFLRGLADDGLRFITETQYCNEKIQISDDERSNHILYSSLQEEEKKIKKHEDSLAEYANKCKKIFEGFLSEESMTFLDRVKIQLNMEETCSIQEESFQYQDPELAAKYLEVCEDQLLSKKFDESGGYQEFLENVNMVEKLKENQLRFRMDALEEKRYAYKQYLYLKTYTTHEMRRSYFDFMQLLTKGLEILESRIIMAELMADGSVSGITREQILKARKLVVYLFSLKCSQMFKVLVERMIKVDDETEETYLAITNQLQPSLLNKWKVVYRELQDLADRLFAKWNSELRRINNFPEDVLHLNEELYEEGKHKKDFSEYSYMEIRKHDKNDPLSKRLLRKLDDLDGFRKAQERVVSDGLWKALKKNPNLVEFQEMTMIEAKDVEDDRFWAQFVAEKKAFMEKYKDIADLQQRKEELQVDVYKKNQWFAPCDLAREVNEADIKEKALALARQQVAGQMEETRAEREEAERRAVQRKKEEDILAARKKKENQKKRLMEKLQKLNNDAENSKTQEQIEKVQIEERLESIEIMRQNPEQDMPPELEQEYQDLSQKLKSFELDSSRDKSLECVGILKSMAVENPNDFLDENGNIRRGHVKDVGDFGLHFQNDNFELRRQPMTSSRTETSDGEDNDGLQFIESGSEFEENLEMSGRPYKISDGKIQVQDVHGKQYKRVAKDGVHRIQLGIKECDHQTIKKMLVLSGHKNVVRYYSVERIKKRLFVTTDWSDISLSTCERKKLRVRMMTIQLLNGMQYLHAEGIFHRYLKPKHILLFPTTTSEHGRFDNYILKIADIGLTKNDKDQHWVFPELRNAAADPITRDLCSTGFLVYFMLLYTIKEKVFTKRAEFRPFFLPININKSINCVMKNERFTNGSPILASNFISNFVAEDFQSYDEALQHPYLWSDRKMLDFICQMSTMVSEADADDFNRRLNRINEKVQQRLPNLCRYIGEEGLGYAMVTPSNLMKTIRNVVVHFNEDIKLPDEPAKEAALKKLRVLNKS